MPNSSSKRRNQPVAAAGEPVQRLLAPSVTALSGVTLDGQQLSAAGNWRGPTNSETIASGAHGYELTIGQTSAALVEVRSRPGAL